MTKEITKGIITKGVGGLYTVLPVQAGGAGEPVLCRARGKFRLDGITPLPGDEVQILPTGELGEIPEGLETLEETEKAMRDGILALISPVMTLTDGL